MSYLLCLYRRRAEIDFAIVLSCAGQLPVPTCNASTTASLFRRQNHQSSSTKRSVGILQSSGDIASRSRVLDAVHNGQEHYLDDWAVLLYAHI